MKSIFVISVILILGTGQAAYAGCGNLQSPPSNQPADVKFVNGSAGKVNVLWYKFKGGTRKYRSLAPNQAYVQPTYVRHVWAFTNSKGQCLGTYVVHGSGTFDIP